MIALHSSQPEAFCSFKNTQINWMLLQACPPWLRATERFVDVTTTTLTMLIKLKRLRIKTNLQT